MRNSVLIASVLVLLLVFVLAGQSFGNVLYVSLYSPTDGPGDSWATAYRYIDSAIAAAANGDEIRVAGGEYGSVAMNKAVSLYGGYCGDPSGRSDPDVRDWTQYPSIFDGSHYTHAVTVPSRTGSVKLDGFTIRNGSSTFGGGVYSYMAGPLTVANCTITGNVATNSGGGIYVMSGSLTMYNNVVAGNVAYTNGGGVYQSGGTGTSFASTNDTIAGNTATTGGAVWTYGPLTITNDIVAFNSSGVHNNNGSKTPTFANNCFYNDGPDYSDYSGYKGPIKSGTGNIQADPQFVELGLGDLHIQPGSACIDAGSDSVVQPDGVDMDGAARISGTHVDMGADECDGVTRSFCPVVFYVSPNGNDNSAGTSWRTAKKTIAAAVKALRMYNPNPPFPPPPPPHPQSPTGIGEIWVAAGTYPERLTLSNQIFFYGGFAGTETSRSQRDIAANPTVLDGLAGGSVITAQYLPDRCAGVDGFVIRNGKAARGGGIFCNLAGPIISNNIITQNTATDAGGAICCDSASPVISGNTISSNSLTGQTALGGWAIYCGANCYSTISGNSIVSNTGAGYGVIECTSSSSPKILNNTISGNSGSYTSSDAGVSCEQGSSATISGNSIVGGTGYGIACSGDSTGIVGPTSVTISGNAVRGHSNKGISCIYCNSTISNNSVIGNGGYGIEVHTSTGTSTVTNNTVSSNTIGVNWWGATGLIANNVITANSNGGIYCSGSSVSIVNNTITGNYAANGGGIYCYGAPRITNNIVAFNSSGIYGGGSVSFNCVYNPDGANYYGVTPGCDINVDPKLVAVGYGQVHLLPGSPCIGRGNDSEVQSGWTDIDGQARISGTHVDIGADEYDGTAWTYNPILVRVSPNGDDANDGSSWQKAMRTVQAGACAASARGGEVWVAAGTYNEIILLPAYVSLYGGFAGTESQRSERNVQANPTIIDGHQAGCVIEAISGYKAAANPVIDGFTICGGTLVPGTTAGGIWCTAPSATIANNTITTNAGDGVDCDGASPTLQGNTITSNGGDGIDCHVAGATITSNIITSNTGKGIDYSGTGLTISGNTISKNGSSGVSLNSSTGTLDSNTISGNGACGLVCTGSSLTLTGNTISGNTAGSSNGGGISCTGSALTAQGNTISSNSAAAGGGVYATTSSLAFSGNTVESNTTTGLGGGIYLLSCTGVPSLTGNTIKSNTGATNGGGVCCTSTTASFSENTFSGNKATSYGGALYCDSCSPTISKNSMLSNSAQSGGGLYCANTSSPTISGNTFTGNTASLYGGGVYTATGCVPPISGNTLSSNTGVLGGGLCICASSTVTNNLIGSNTAAYGGGLYCFSGYPIINDNRIVGNTATSYRGGGIYCKAGSGSPTITCNTVLSNTAVSPTDPTQAFGGGIYAESGVSGKAYCNIVAFNSSGIYGGFILRNNCVYNPAGYNYKAMVAGPGDVQVDPLLVNIAGGDYHLRSNSPCIDAGWASATGIPATDMDGEIRIIGVVDIGADEYYAGIARTPAEAKSAADTAQVDIYGAIVTALSEDGFYMETDDRMCGIYVYYMKCGSPLQVRLGDRAHVIGHPGKYNWERCVYADSADLVGTGSVAPLAMPVRAVGGGDFGLQSGVWGWVTSVDDTGNQTKTWSKVSGLNNIGLLITTWGKVTGIDPDIAPEWFTIDDGSGLNVKCTVGSGVIDPTWQYVRVTGISSCWKYTSDVRPEIRIRPQTGIQAF